LNFWKSTEHVEEKSLRTEEKTEVQNQKEKVEETPVNNPSYG